MRRSRLMAGLTVTALVGVMALALTTGGGRPPGARAQQPGDPALVRELAERALGRAGTPATLYPGALPPGFPSDATLPPGSRLVGGVSGAAGIVPGNSITVVADAPGAAAEVLSFFRNTLVAAGWTPYSPQTVQAGFIPSASSTSATLCASDNGAYLNVTARGTAGGPTDVRLSAETGSPTPCSFRGSRSTGGQPGTGIIPALQPPPGMQVQHLGNSFGPTLVGFDASASGSLSGPDLASSYEVQLVAAGWTRTDGRADGALIWSTWSVPGGTGDRQGLLYVLPGTRPQQFTLHVQVAPLSIEDIVAASGSDGGLAVIGVNEAFQLDPLVTPTPMPTPR